VVFSNSTGSTNKVSFTINNVASSQDLIDAINNNSDIQANGIKASIVNNKLVITSASGAQEVELNSSESNNG